MPRLWLPVLCVVLACDKSPAPASTEQPAVVAPAAGGEPAGDPAASQDVATARPQDTAVPAAIGKPAPNFALPDLDGATHTLASHAGKTVVLEWFNPECPFVDYAHTKGPLVNLARQQVEQGVVWLAINSGAPGMQGADVATNATKVGKYAMTHPVLLDPDGVVGRLYGAEKTPHMYVIDGSGTLQYAGGVDNAPFGEVDGDQARADYLVLALAAVAASQPVTTPTAAAWGCTVTYAKQ